MIFEEILTKLNSPEFQTLRPMQHSVLEQYSLLLDSKGVPTKPDIAIEMPAGTGKTLVALLITEYHRNLNKRTAILTGTRQLAKQVAEDADILGVPTAVFEGPGQDWSSKELRRYQRSETIGIMNYWAYFNINPKPIPAEILILDDAHLAESAISNLFSIRIKSSENNKLYKDIISMIGSLRPGRYTVIDDILLDIPVDVPFLLPFSDWQELSDRVTQLLDEAVKSNVDQVRFVWPQIRKHSDALGLFITPYELQLRPIIYPSRTFRHFTDPIQRLYLSATLGDPGDLQRRIGCDTIHLLQPTDPQPGERGRRLIVLFPSKEEGKNQNKITNIGLSTVWPVARKRLWMCSSWHEAEEWKSKIPPLKNGTRTHIWELRGSDESPLENFRQASLGHLFTAARYDGIDFPGDQCRLALLTSPPVTSDPQEEFFSAYLQDATFLKSRFSQRVAQALGRCNRASSDFAVYLFLDPKFERKFGGNDPDYLSYLPHDIQAEMESALENCEDGFVTCCTGAKDFLSGTFEKWDSQVKGIREKIQPKKKTPATASCAHNEVSGWLALWNGDPVGAIGYFKKWEEENIKQHISGPLAFSRYCLAWVHYLCHIRVNDPTALQDTIRLLEGSASCGPSSWFTTYLRASAYDLQKDLKKQVTITQNISDYKDSIFEQWEKILLERGLKESSLRKWLSNIKENIESFSHDQVVEGVYNLGPLIGFDAFRPRGQGMPDVVWRFSRDKRFIFTLEVKAELAADRKVTMRDVDQAHGQGRWADKNYSKDSYQCSPFILTCSDDFEPGVVDKLGNVRCITQSSLCILATHVINTFEEFRSLWDANDSDKRFQARQRVYSKLPDGDWLFEAHKSTKPGFIPEGILYSKWQRSA